jgi:hypothetical protein
MPYLRGMGMGEAERAGGLRVLFEGNGCKMNGWDIHRVSCSLDQLRRFEMGDDSKNLSAFPVIPPSGNAAGFPYPESGMTLRDYFAAKAMQGVLANGMPFYNVSEYAYKVADLMMEERDK